MSTQWSYSGDPTTSKRDAVRFKIGDVVPSDALLTDAEIDFCVESEGSINEAAIAAAKALVAKFARQVAVSEDKVSKALQQRVEHFRQLVVSLTANRHKRTLGIYAGGISQVERQKSAFTRDMHESPGHCSGKR